MHETDDPNISMFGVEDPDMDSLNLSDLSQFVRMMLLYWCPKQILTLILNFFRGDICANKSRVYLSICWETDAISMLGRQEQRAKRLNS